MVLMFKLCLRSLIETVCHRSFSYDRTDAEQSIAGLQAQTVRATLGVHLLIAAARTESAAPQVTH